MEVVIIDIEKLIGVKEACEILGVARATLYNYMKKGLPHYKIGKLVKFRTSDLEDWIQNQKQE